MAFKDFIPIRGMNQSGSQTSSSGFPQKNHDEAILLSADTRPWKRPSRGGLTHGELDTHLDLTAELQ